MDSGGDKKKRTGVAGFGNVPDSSDEKQKKENEYYAGGKSSGVAVFGRPDEAEERGDVVVERLTKQAKEAGAVVDSFEEAEKPKWGGAGVSLNGETRVDGGSTKPREQVVRVLTMFEDGFTVDEGTFRPFADPANKPFLDEIGRGVIPSELEQEAQGGELHVDLVDKRSQKYKESSDATVPPRVQAFSGHGQTLSGAPNVSAPANLDIVGTLAPVDKNFPTTQIQIRSGDGKRAVGTFNPTRHTVADILRFASQHGMHGTLSSSMPRRVFGPADMELSIEAAALQGAALMIA